VNMGCSLPRGIHPVVRQSAWGSTNVHASNGRYGDYRLAKVSAVDARRAATARTAPRF